MCHANKIWSKEEPKRKLVQRDKEGNDMLIKGTIHQKHITVVNISTEHWCTQFCETNSIKQRDSRSKYNNSGLLQYPTVINT
jgi:hypothetical protein